MKYRNSAMLAIAMTLSFSAAAHSDQQSHFLLGAYVGTGQGKDGVEAFEKEIGHTIAMVDHYLRFDGTLQKSVMADVEAGRIPMISWTSTTLDGGNVHALDILARKYDAQINAVAESIALLNGTVLVRWQPEMTDNARNKEFFAGVAPDQQGPTYIAVWKHMRKIFARKGATNVQWVWAPGGNAYILKHGAFKCGAFFPGADFVDWMGLDSYNKSDTPEAYDTNLQFLSFYAIAPLLAPGKPLMNTQTGATHTTDAQREWIATAQSSLQNEFPLVRGFEWFNVDTDKSQEGSSRQYKLEGAGLDAFKALAADPYFQ